MAIPARNVQEMQTALANTVGVVREGADTIYTGAGEISAGSNDLSPVPSSRPLLWKRRQPAWNS